MGEHTKKVFFSHTLAKYHFILKVKDSLVISVTRYSTGLAANDCQAASSVHCQIL